MICQECRMHTTTIGHIPSCSFNPYKDEKEEECKTCIDYPGAGHYHGVTWVGDDNQKVDAPDGNR